MTNLLLEKIRINNTASLHDEATQALRAVTEKRAATIAYILDETEKLGLNDTFARKAITHYGQDLGEKMAQRMNNPADLREFATLFTSGLEARAYEMETVHISDDTFIVHFHYCPYVNQWLQQNRNAEQIEKLCDVCLEGDNAITHSFENLSFYPEQTIARGHSHCEMCFRRVK
jgi:predicted ArsR family transcriptional regulator